MATYPDNPAREHSLELTLSGMFCLNGWIHSMLRLARRLGGLERFVGAVNVLEE